MRFCNHWGFCMDGQRKVSQGPHSASSRGVVVADGCEAEAREREHAPAAALPASQWDLLELMERLDGDEEFLRELLLIFYQDARKLLGQAREALAARNYQDLTRAAHTLKGMLKNLAMKAAGLQAASLENAARKESPIEAEEHVRLLEKEMDELRPHVEARLGEVKP